MNKVITGKKNLLWVIYSDFVLVGCYAFFFKKMCTCEYFGECVHVSFNKLLMLVSSMKLGKETVTCYREETSTRMANVKTIQLNL